jgi:hypothetical protein
MLTNREKALVVLAYYKGTGDHDIMRGGNTKQAVEISIECTERILGELGLEIDFETDFNEFMQELNVITGILSKEYGVMPDSWNKET